MNKPEKRSKKAKVFQPLRIKRSSISAYVVTRFRVSNGWTKCLTIRNLIFLLIIGFVVILVLSNWILFGFLLDKALRLVQQKSQVHFNEIYLGVEANLLGPIVAINGVASALHSRLLNDSTPFETAKDFLVKTYVSNLETLEYNGMRLVVYINTKDYIKNLGLEYRNNTLFLTRYWSGIDPYSNETNFFKLFQISLDGSFEEENYIKKIKINPSRTGIFRLENNLEGWDTPYLFWCGQNPSIGLCDLMLSYIIPVHQEDEYLGVVIGAMKSKTTLGKVLSSHTLSHHYSFIIDYKSGIVAGTSDFSSPNYKINKDGSITDVIKYTDHPNTIIRTFGNKLALMKATNSSATSILLLSGQHVVFGKVIKKKGMEIWIFYAASIWQIALEPTMYGIIYLIAQIAIVVCLFLFGYKFTMFITGELKNLQKNICLANDISQLDNIISDFENRRTIVLLGDMREMTHSVLKLLRALVYYRTFLPQYLKNSVSHGGGGSIASYESSENDEDDSDDGSQTSPTSSSQSSSNEHIENYYSLPHRICLVMINISSYLEDFQTITFFDQLLDIIHVLCKRYKGILDDFSLRRIVVGFNVGNRDLKNFVKNACSFAIELKKIALSNEWRCCVRIATSTGSLFDVGSSKDRKRVIVGNCVDKLHVLDKFARGKREFKGKTLICTETTDDLNDHSSSADLKFFVKHPVAIITYSSTSFIVFLLEGISMGDNDSEWLYSIDEIETNEKRRKKEDIWKKALEGKFEEITKDGKLYDPLLEQYYEKYKVKEDSKPLGVIFEKIVFD